jgi:signal transduction histidine kinase
MKPFRSPTQGISITLRTALLSWLVTIVTLLIFVTAIIPEQKHTFELNLHSKAQALVAAVHGVAASAVVTEDYPTLVDHGLSVLRSDSSIDYLILVKNDGTGHVWQQQDPKWNPETLDDSWRPTLRTTVSGIGVVPRFNRRVFYYSQPFDYSGIQWGWIHVGFSLESYDRSVATVYRRTGLIAILCVALSFVASMAYAKRLVHPILILRRTVEQVAGGDLSVRANIQSGDEIGSLATSINAMTEALLRRDLILQSVRFAAQQFLSAADWNTAAERVLAKIGRAAEASRAYIFENFIDAHGVLRSTQRFEWASPGTTPQIGNPALQGFGYAETGFGRWCRLLEQGEIISGPVHQMAPEEAAVLQPQSIRSLIIIPIRVDGHWWGFLGLDDCHRERVWTDAEQDSLRAAADMFGATITRQRTRDALVESKETLEERVRERTRELEEQVVAKEKARADLAEAQVSLMEASRAAGKAEVATSVLHNVGNVLNSVGVSATIVCDRLRLSKLANLKRATAMLREQNGNLARFLTEDPKGRLLPEYLSRLGDQLGDEQTEALKELDELSRNIEHIKKIVAMQQTYAKVSGSHEEIEAAQLIDDALPMISSSITKHRIQVIRKADDHLPRINVDRHKVLQILINLLRNAKESLVNSTTSEKRLELSVHCRDGRTLLIRVRDNGLGIAPENLTRIFRHGFTTKKEGHGFGLHGAANAAKEMHGRLSVHSDGLGLGAEFTLELPVSHPETATTV